MTFSPEQQAALWPGDWPRACAAYTQSARPGLPDEPRSGYVVGSTIERRVIVLVNYTGAELARYALRGQLPAAERVG